MRLLALSVFAVLVACSPARSSTDAGARDGASPGVDAGGGADAAASDAGTPDGGSVGDAGDTSDAACPDHFAACPLPPVGTTRCGGGAIDPTMSRAACDALDPALDLGMGLMKACSAFTVVSGRYEVWCGATVVYVWASFDALASSDVLDCPFSVPLPDGGTLSASVDQLSWGLSDTNDQLYASFTTTGGRTGGMLSGRAWPYASSDRATDASHWTGSVAFDGALSVGAGVTGGTGNLFLTAAQDDCDGVPTSAGFRVVLAVPITWP